MQDNMMRNINKENVQQDGDYEEYHLMDKGLVGFKNRIYVPYDDDLEWVIM